LDKLFFGFVGVAHFFLRSLPVKAKGFEPELGFAFGQAGAFGSRLFASFLFAEPFYYYGPELVGLDGGCFSSGGGIANSAVGADDGQVCGGGAVEYSLFDNSVAIGIAAGKGNFQIAYIIESCFVGRADAVEDDFGFVACKAEVYIEGLTHRGIGYGCVFIGVLNGPQQVVPVDNNRHILIFYLLFSICDFQLIIDY
jgi:hypothetical protein